jgi:hypothetical protein
MAKTTNHTSKTHAAKTAAKPRTAPGREAKGVAPTPQALVQAGHNAGTLYGYRLALDACAKNLRAQATVLRAPGAELTIRGVIESASRLLHRKAQADLLDACAAAIEAQHAARAAEEQSLARAAEALLAAAQGAK